MAIGIYSSSDQLSDGTTGWLVLADEWTLSLSMYCRYWQYWWLQLSNDHPYYIYSLHNSLIAAYVPSSILRLLRHINIYLFLGGDG